MLRHVDLATRWSVGLWVIFGLLPTLALTAKPLGTLEWKTWQAVLQDQGLAAWTQAVGGLLAIAGSAAIAIWVSHNESVRNANQLREQRLTLDLNEAKKALAHVIACREALAPYLDAVELGIGATRLEYLGPPIFERQAGLLSQVAVSIGSAVEVNALLRVRAAVDLLTLAATTALQRTRLEETAAVCQNFRTVSQGAYEELQRQVFAAQQRLAALSAS